VRCALCFGTKGSTQIRHDLRYNYRCDLRQRPNATCCVPLSPHPSSPAGQLTADATTARSVIHAQRPTNHTRQCKRDLTDLTLTRWSTRQRGKSEETESVQAACGFRQPAARFTPAGSCFYELPVPGGPAPRSTPPTSVAGPVPYSCTVEYSIGVLAFGFGQLRHAAPRPHCAATRALNCTVL
jgi:hypothetical protein